MSEIADISIIGAGVVGLAVAAEVAREDRSVYVLEKNDSFGKETSSRHSGVIHAGIYYPEGSLKARLCVEGNRQLYELCKKNGIPHRNTGKLVVAASDDEMDALQGLYKRGIANGTDLQMLTKEEVNDMESNLNAIAALWSPSTGIIDSHSLMLHYINEAILSCAQIAYQCEVVGIEKAPGGYRVTVNDWSGGFSFDTRTLINCAGLYSDKIAGMAGIDIDKAGYRLYYCRGEFYSLDNSKKGLVQRLVYSVPPPSLASAGLHIVFDLDGRLRIGPGIEYVDSIDYSMDSRHKQLFYDSVKRYLPAIEVDDLEPEMAGIRPKLQPPDGEVRDFVIREESDKGLPGLINLIGIDSPGLTASSAIGRYVGEMVEGILK